MRARAARLAPALPLVSAALTGCGEQQTPAPAPEGSELRYADGSTVDVPAGPLAGAVEKLHARSPRPVVICYVDTGAYEHYRPDAPSPR
ncbi:hypothetical protein RB200_12185 [Streptomyces sp. PmtG]